MKPFCAPALLLPLVILVFCLSSLFPSPTSAFTLKKSGVFLVPQTAYGDILEYAKSSADEHKLDLTEAEVSRVERCFYTKDWLVDRSDECFWMSDLSDRKHKLPSLRDVQFRIAYAKLIEQSKKDERLVSQCFREHRYDHFAQCKGISWNVCEENEGKKPEVLKTTERQKLRKFYWDRLAKADPEYYALEC